MPKQKTNSSGEALKDTAREIGSKIGAVHAKASRMVEGVKAAVKASRAALSRKTKKTAKKKTAKKKSGSSSHKGK